MVHRWLRIAHRGASGSTPEHTRPAFERAVELGVDMIELDVQLSRDEKLVVIHDMELTRTTNGTGRVRDRDLAAIKRLDAGRWFSPAFADQPSLTLGEVIRLLDGRARLNVELKAADEDWVALAAEVIRELRATDLLRSTLLSCFEPAALTAVRRAAADARIGLLWQQSDFADAWRWTGDLHATSLHPHWMLVSADLVQAAHGRGLQLVAWTVNDVDTMRALVGQGVDGIISDFPERFGQVEG